MGILKLEGFVDIFHLEQEEKGSFDARSWEQIKPFGYIPFEPGKKVNPPGLG